MEEIERSVLRRQLVASIVVSRPRYELTEEGRAALALEVPQCA